MSRMNVNSFQQINSFKNGSISNESLSNILSKFNTGDVFRAFVIEANTNELLLKLFDGTVFSASSLINIDAKPGDTLDFLVAGKSEKQLILETVKSKEDDVRSLEHQIRRELIQNNIKPSRQNLEIGVQLKEHDLPLSEDLFKAVESSLVGQKGLSIEEAVFLVENMLEPNEKNIGLLNDLIYGRLKISSMLDDLISMLEKLNNKDFNEQMIKVILSSNAADNTIIENNGSYFDLTSAIKHCIDIIAGSIQSNENKEFVANPIFHEKLASFVKNNIDNISNDSILLKQINDFLNTECKNDMLLPGTDREELIGIIARTVLTVKDEIVQKSSISDKDIESWNPKVMKEENLLIKLVENLQIRIDSEKTKPELSVKGLYKELYTRLEIIKNVLSSLNASESNEILDTIDYIQNGIKFLNDINNYNAYIQIPLKAWEKSFTGELYILKRGNKKKKINPSDVTMLLSLDTANMGKVDSLIVINKKNISVNLRLTDQRIIDFFKANYKRLYEGLASKGYKLFDIKYRIISEDTNILNAERYIKKELDFNKGSVDLKV